MTSSITTKRFCTITFLITIQLLKYVIEMLQIKRSPSKLLPSVAKAMEDVSAITNAQHYAMA